MPAPNEYKNVFVCTQDLPCLHLPSYYATTVFYEDNKTKI